jgi:hypothetical protein
MARWNALEKNDARGLYVSLFHPKGHEVACQSLVLPAEETRLNNFMWVLTIGAEFDVAGQWSLRVHSGGGYQLSTTSMYLLASWRPFSELGVESRTWR